MSDLRTTLVEAGIDLEKWGIGKAKNLGYLEKEIFFGETVIGYDDKGQLVRSVRIVNSDIYFIDDQGAKYRLKHDKQVFASGRVRKRQFDRSVSEKCQFEEVPNDTIMRGLREELGITRVRF
jgi:hypothetical protein